MGELRTYVVRAVVVAAAVGAGIACTATVGAATAAVRPASRQSQGCSNPSDAVLAIRAATNTRERDIKLGRGADPEAIVMTPNGKTAYVALFGDDEVLPISTATSKPGRAIKVGGGPDAITITPNGRTVYVANFVSDTVTPISTATNKAGRAIKVDVSPGVIGITPNGRTVYVGNGSLIGTPSATPVNAVVPISTASNKAGRTLLIPVYDNVPASAAAFAFSRNSKIAYVAAAYVNTINVASDTFGRVIQAGYDPGPIVITPNGKTAYEVDFGAARVTTFSTVTNKAGRAITVGAELGPMAATTAIALTPNGKTLYVGTGSFAAGEDDAVTPVSTTANRPGKAIRVGQGLNAIVITPNGKTAYVSSSDAGTVTPIRIATSTAGRPIDVGTDLAPNTIAITPNGATLYALDAATCASPTPPGDSRATSVTRTTSVPGVSATLATSVTRAASAARGWPGDGRRSRS